MFFSNGIIYYERYIDDSILILNEHMEETEVKEKLETVLLKIFHDQTIKAPKCHTKFNKKGLFSSVIAKTHMGYMQV